MAKQTEFFTIYFNPEVPERKIEVINQMFQGCPAINEDMENDIGLLWFYNNLDPDENYVSAESAAQLLHVTEDELMEWNFGIRVLLLGARCHNGKEVYNSKLLRAYQILYCMPD
jgi:hypothetical protein